MRAARKSYGFDYEAVAEPFFLDVDEATLTERRSGRTKLYQASALCPQSDLSRPLLSAFCRLTDGQTIDRMHQRWGALKAFAEFAVSSMALTSIDEVKRETFEHYRLHLRQLVIGSKMAPRSAYSRFQMSQSIAAEALRARGTILRIIPNPFPGIGRAGAPKGHIAKADLANILSAAKREATKVWFDFNASRDVDPDTPIGKALAFVKTHWTGVVPLPRAKVLQHAEFRKIYGKAGTMEDLMRRLHATRDSLLPFLILIGFSTAANVTSLAEMERDCMSDGLIPGSFEIRWTKRRASSDQAVVRSDASRFSAPALIRQVLAMTEPLLRYVSEADRDRLFIARGNGSKGGFGAYTTQSWAHALRSFIKRNQLRGRDGRPLKCALEMLRPTALQHAYLKTGDITAVRRFANHRHLSTTIRYVVDRLTDEVHDGVIARSQRKLHDFVRSGGKPTIVRPSASRAGMAEAARGMANDCADIHDGPTSKGQCPAWLWPLNDPALVVPNDPRYVAEIVRVQRALDEARPEMRPERFQRNYGAMVVTIADILARFDSELLAEAERRATLLGPLPSIADD